MSSLCPDLSRLVQATNPDSNPPSCRIGGGGFGTVFKCKLNGKTAVAKQICPARLAAKDLPLLQNEMCLWAQLDHPNCVKFFGVSFDPTEFYYLLCEYMPGGSLFDRHNALRSQATPPRPQTPQMLMEMRQIAGAMDHLHSKNILHRDLKSANVLVAEDGRLVVADFGLVRYCRACSRVEPQAYHNPRLRCLAVPLTALASGLLPRRVGRAGEHDRGDGLVPVDGTRGERRNPTP